MFDFAAAFGALQARCPAARLQPCVQRLYEQQVGIAAAALQCMQVAAGAPQSLPPLPPLLPPTLPATCVADSRRPLCSALTPANYPLLLPQGTASPAQYLAAVQQLLPLYECTLAVATLFRPVLLKAAAALVDAAVGGSAAAVQPSAELAVALLTVLELAPHTEGCVGWAAALPSLNHFTLGGIAAPQLCAMLPGLACPKLHLAARQPTRCSLPPPAGRCCATSATHTHLLSTSRKPAALAACQRHSWRAARYEACSCCPSCNGQWRRHCLRCCSTSSRMCDGVPLTARHWCSACRTPAGHRCGQPAVVVPSGAVAY